VDGDGVADSSPLTDSAGNFSLVPTTLAAGTIAVNLRVEEWIPQVSSVSSDWMPFEFTFDPNANLPPAVLQFALFNDTGASSTDGVTRDPRLAGSVSDDGNLARLVVQFDLNSDGQSDGAAEPDAAGAFQFTPAGLAAGPITAYARAGERMPDQSVSNFGDWQPLNFTLETGSTTNPPNIAQIKLFKDTGDSSTDNNSSDPRITGRAANDGSVNQLRIEFDHDNDGFAESFTTTDGDGDFIYTRQGLTAGPVTIRARAGESDGVSGWVFGQWSSLAFQLDGEGTHLPPEVFKLKLLNDTGDSNTDRITNDASLILWVTNDGESGNLLVEFDHDGDRFKFTGREYDSETGLYFYRARYYDPSTGRFTRLDPVSFTAGDENLYRYVSNSVVMLTDPSGMGWWDDWGPTIAGGLSGAISGAFTGCITGLIISAGNPAGCAAGAVGGAILGGVSGAITGASQDSIGAAIGMGGLAGGVSGIGGGVIGVGVASALGLGGIVVTGTAMTFGSIGCVSGAIGALIGGADMGGAVLGCGAGAAIGLAGYALPIPTGISASAEAGYIILYNIPLSITEWAAGYIVGNADVFGP
jgi:RHS repeat-associated protein